MKSAIVQVEKGLENRNGGFSAGDFIKTRKVVSRQPNLLVNLKSNTMKNTVQM